METCLAKVIAIVSLFAVVLVFGLLPVKLLHVLRGTRIPETGSAKRSRAEILIDLLNCFGGGVFLATSLLHLLPDVRRDIESLLEASNQSTSFPVAEFITCMGFFLVMFLEHLILLCYENHSLNHLEKKNLKQETSSVLPTCRQFSSAGYGSIPEMNGKPGKSIAPKFTVDFTRKSNVEDFTNDGRISVGNCVDLTDHTLSEGHTDHHHGDHHQGDVQTLRSFVFLLALSIHTIFEGLALGLQSSAQQVFTLLIAVLIHKAVISFTVGVRFAESFHDVRRTALSLLVLSIMAPVGVAIGIAVTESGVRGFATDLASAVLQGFATGTFLFVTFFEVLFQQMKDGHDVLKVLGVLLGFACITIMEVFIHTDNH